MAIRFGNSGYFFVLIWLFLAVCGQHLTAAPPQEQVKSFENLPFSTVDDGFGAAIAIKNNLVLIGAPTNSLNGNRIGQAHLFDAVSGELIQTFDDPNPVNSDLFGTSAAISDDGSRILIGAPGPSMVQGVGQAYLFDAGNGSLLNTIDCPDPTGTGMLFGGEFGSKVAMDDNFILISARSFNQIGQAYLFDADTLELLHVLDDPSPSFEPDLSGILDAFGSSIAIDNNTIVIGAPLDSRRVVFAGEVYVFDALSGELAFSLESPDSGMFGSSGLFGTAVDISGDKIVVGAPIEGSEFGFGPGSVYVFSRTGQFERTLELPTGAIGFGGSVALDGNRLLVGATGTTTSDQRAGQVYLFDASTGQLTEVFNDPSPINSDNFGSSVAISDKFAAIGSGASSISGLAGDAHLFALEVTLGDINRDGNIDFFDIQPFIDLLTNNEFQCEADFNADEVVTFLDIQGFIEALTP